MSYCKVGFHTGPSGNMTGIGDYFRRLDDAGIPCVLKSVGNAGPLYELQEMARVSGVPHVLIYRKSGVSGDQSKNYDTPDYDLSPELAAERHWRLHMNAWPPELDPSMVWIETVNEPDKDRAGWLAEFSWHTAMLAQYDSHKYAAFGWSYGEPEFGHWQGSKMQRFLALCGDNPDRLAVALHEYSQNVDDIRDSYPYRIGRHKDLFIACDSLGIDRPTVFITEWGWEKGKVPAPDQAMLDIDWAARIYNRYSEIKGVALWYLGSGFDGIANKAQQLIEPMTEFSLEFTAPEPEPPNTGEPTCQVRVQYPRRYWVVPGRTPLERRKEIYLLAAEKQVTVGPSFDDAGIGNLLDKTAVLFDTLYSRDQEFLDWYEKHYSGTKVEFRRNALEPVGPEPFYLLWPTNEKRLTQLFGNDPDYYGQFGLPGHEGLDMAAAYGSPIRACYDGVVYAVYPSSDGHNYGIHVRLAHTFPDGQQYKTVYAHLESINVRLGDTVKQGDVIGDANNTGNSRGSHLHLTVKLVGATAAGLTNYSWDIIDPTKFFDLRDVVMPISDTGYAFKDWAPSKFLAGVHARADGGDPRLADYKAVGNARVNALKLLTTCTPAHINMWNAEFDGIGRDQFTMARMFASFDDDRVVSAEDFVHWLLPDMQRLYDVGVRYFEIHNEPNLRKEGFGASWKDGHQFASWFLVVQNEFKNLFHDAKFGFPGCSPGSDVMYDDGRLARRSQWQFLEEAIAAVRAADWVGVHCYWLSRAEMLSEEHGMGWKRFARRWPEKLLLITEFGNALPYIAKSEKGQQYRNYYQELARQQSVGAAFSFVVSGSGWPGWCWVDESGEINEIAGIVGSRG